MATRYVRGGFENEITHQKYIPIGKYAVNTLKILAVGAFAYGWFCFAKNEIMKAYKGQNAKAEQIIQAGDRKAASKLLADTRTERTKDPIVPLSDGNEEGLQRLVNQ